MGPGSNTENGESCSDHRDPDTAVRLFCFLQQQHQSVQTEIRDHQVLPQE